MLTSRPRISLSRRSFLGVALGALGAAALRDTTPDAFAGEPANVPGGAPGKAPSTGPKAAADAVILLWMNGGPSHLDTFDPKPGNSKVMGPMRAIPTAISGVQFGEHLPLLAKEAKRLAVIRGLSSKEGSHDRAQSLGHTGHTPNPTAAYPSFGAWTSKVLGSRDPELPAYVSLNGPGHDAGFFGAGHAPFVVSTPGAPPDNTDPGVSDARFSHRREALSILEDGFSARTKAPFIADRRAVYDRAFSLMRSPKLSAFDLASEPEKIVKAYGDTPFGKGCLTARRLIEAGVRLVEVTLDGWDTHQDNFNRVKTQCAALDPAMSALLVDLADRKLLDRTLVICMGDFGRTPHITSDDGRDHHPAAYSAVLAGGGVRGGVVIGGTDADGDQVKDGKTSVPDLLATVAHQLGMDPNQSVQAPNGRPVSVTDGGLVIDGLVQP
ncbi:MAG: DUF1501 domain-containing protein [Polyangiaceae bacterium]